MRAGLDLFRENAEPFPRRLQVASKRENARHGVGTVEGETGVAEEIEREAGFAVRGGRNVPLIPCRTFSP
jgi:hypothetical protein